MDLKMGLVSWMEFRSCIAYCEVIVLVLDTVTVPAPVSSVIMNLRNRKKTASISNIWTPRSSAAKHQNTIRATELEITTARPRFFAQRIVQQKPFASLEDFSVEQLTAPPTSNPEAEATTTTTETDAAIAISPRATSLGQFVSTTSNAETVLPTTYNEKPTDTPTLGALGTTVFDIPNDPPIVHGDDIYLLELIDELPDIDSSSLEVRSTDERNMAPTATTETQRSKSTPPINIVDPFRSSEYFDSMDDNSNDAMMKSKRAVGNEKLLPIGEIVRPAQQAAKAKQTLAERLQNESSAERAERIQKNIQRLMHFVTIVGHVDSYLSKRFRTGVKKMAQLYDSTENAHLRPRTPPRRHRRRTRFGLLSK